MKKKKKSSYLTSQAFTKLFFLHYFTCVMENESVFSLFV